MGSTTHRLCPGGTWRCGGFCRISCQTCWRACGPSPFRPCPPPRPASSALRVCRLQVSWSWRLAGRAGQGVWWEVDDLAGRAGRSRAGLGLADLGLAGLVGPVHSRSDLVGHIDLRLAVAGRSLGRPAGRNPDLEPAGYNRLGRPVDRTAVADRIETFFWKVEIEGSSDELENSLMWIFGENLFVEMVVREGLVNPC